MCLMTLVFANDRSTVIPAGVDGPPCSIGDLVRGFHSVPQLQQHVTIVAGMGEISTTTTGRPTLYRPICVAPGDSNEVRHLLGDIAEHQAA